MFQLFGFEIKKKESEVENDATDDLRVSFAEPVYTDGAININAQQGYAVGGAYGLALDIDSTITSEADLINKYRNMALQPEIRAAVEEVVTAAICVDGHDEVVELNLDKVVGLSFNTKKKIVEEFKQVLHLLAFPENAYYLFKRWYVDGRLNMHIIIDEDNLKSGIVEIRYIDPRKIKLIREFEEIQSDVPGVMLKRIKNEYYIYTEYFSQGSNLSLSSHQVGGIRIAKDSIARVTSGEMNANNTLVLSYLHPAIKPLNQVRMLEDAKLIYTITRAPDRKAFYVDVGNLPPAKAQQYMNDIMNKHKNRAVYDESSGEISTDRNFMTLTQDYWFPRRGGNRITEVDVIQGGNQLADNDDLNYYLNRLQKSLQVPQSRLEPESMYSFGRPSEITREEVKFARFIRRLRSRFSTLFSTCLGKQLVLKGIIRPEDWEIISSSVQYVFSSDNLFEEMKEIEILRERMTMLADVDAQVGKYFSREWVFKNVLYFDEEERKQMLKEIEKEKAAGVYDEYGGVDADGENDAIGDDTDYGDPTANEDEDETEIKSSTEKDEHPQSTHKEYDDEKNE